MTEEDRSAKVGGSALSSAVITGDRNTANITITNYYYHESTTVLPIDSTDAEYESLPCPYRGLFHFGPDDAEYFFGREVFVEELFAATQSRKFIPVLGASGSGKSSVVLAGLVPKLQKRGYWKFTHFRPGSEPFQALAESLIPLYEPNQNATEQMFQARRLAEYFANGSVPLQDVFSKIKRNYPKHRLLLIADQFEELYTLCADREVRHSFLDTLLACFQSDPDNNTVLVGTMRADFLGNLLSYRPLADVLQNADIKLGPMNRDELSQVIVKPAEKLKVTFQDGLVKRILDDVEDEPGNLPLLEFALTQLWKRRTGKQLTHAAYEEIGEVKGALARHADENYGKLSNPEKEQVRRIFIQLVRPGEETEDTRRLATKAELGEASWELVKQLADNRLVVTSQNSANQETVEVVHEALIRNWGEFRQWMNADRSFRAWQDRLRSAMYQWEQTQRDEGALLRGAALAEGEEKLKQRREDISAGEQEFIQASVALRDREQKQRERRRRLTFSGLAGGLVLALGLSGLAGIAWGNAEISEINALAQISDGLLNLDGRKAVESSVKAGVKRRGKFWVDANTRTQVKLALLNTVHNVAAPNTLGGHANAVRGISFSPDGKMLASASVDKTVKLWDTSTSEEIKTLTGHTSGVYGISFSPDGKMLASASVDKTVKLWDTSTGKEIKTLTGHTNAVWGISFSPDGKMLASASVDKTVKLWDTSTGKEIKTLTGHTGGVTGVSFSPDGKMLASASADKTVKLWDTSTGKEIKTLTGYTNSFNCISFSPNGKMLASASADKTVKLWDTSTGKEIKTKQIKTKQIKTKQIKTLIGHTSEVWGISFSPDGKMLASASVDNTVKLWDTSTGKEIKTLIGHTNEVWGISFSPDGKMLASASKDKTVKLWRLDFDYLLQKGCNFVREYYKTNPPDNESDKHLCDGVGNL
jgi:WD40 repeat protein